ncbi:MAG: ATP-binding protein, partial [Candidatus Hydrogenedentes bacterium]|nr:ATP-binding protein [Candidatus Hydrogenedentota bacterium]
MRTISVQVRDDHLELLSRAKPMLALAELIWNALDADSTEVRVEFVDNAMGGIDAIRIHDNGHGLAYDHALVAFQNLGGSWKRDETRTAMGKRALHGQYGKGRFRAFGLGNFVQWHSTFEQDGQRRRFQITGRAANLGEFELTDPEPSDGPVGISVEIADLPSNIGLLRGIKATQEATDFFALYLLQYPGVRIVYDGVPLDPANAEDRSTECDLGEFVMENGERVRASLSIAEWLIPGKRGIVLCDENGFALHMLKPRLLFRGFSYTAFLKSSHFVTLEREGLLQLEDMTPDCKQLIEAARLALRQHFTLREIERAQDTLTQWHLIGIYPYFGAPANRDEETERRIFDIYATHLAQLSAFSEAANANKRLMLRLLRELIHTEPTRVARILDEWLAFPE